MEEYYLIIIMLTILMMFYGGVNKSLKIEYEHKYFEHINNIKVFEKYLLTNNSKENIDLLSISNSYLILINNLFSINYINIKPLSYFINDNMYDKSLLMIIYTVNDDYKKLQVIVDKVDKNRFINYNVTSDLFLTNPYVIYNKSNQNTKLILAFIKKPFWYY